MTGPSKAAGGVKGDDNRQDTVTVSINGDSKDIHRGSYPTAELKKELGVDSTQDIDVIEDGDFRTLTDGERLVVKEGMKFISHARQGGSS